MCVRVGVCACVHVLATWHTHKHTHTHIQNTLTHPARMCCTCAVAELQSGLAGEQVFDNINVASLRGIMQGRHFVHICLIDVGRKIFHLLDHRPQVAAPRERVYIAARHRDVHCRTLDFTTHCTFFRTVSLCVHRKWTFYLTGRRKRGVGAPLFLAGLIG